jgi:hypothetical protein
MEKFKEKCNQLKSEIDISNAKADGFQSKCQDIRKQLEIKGSVSYITSDSFRIL